MIFFVTQKCLPTADAVIPNFNCSSQFVISDIVVLEEEVANLLDNVDVTKACGPDGISNRRIKCCKVGICKPLARLINISLSFGQFPENWKLANVLPCLKKIAVN